MFLAALAIIFSSSRFATAVVFPIIGGAPECANLAAPYLLRADGKPPPALGTTLSPAFSWALPATNVSAVRVQVFSAVGAPATLWDSGPLPRAWSAAAPAALLSQGAPYVWRVGAQSGAGQPPWAWSSNATLVAGLQPGGWVGEPVWHANSDAPFALFRGALPVPRVPYRAVFAFVTAQPQRSPGDKENGKLLGAYKLFVEGALVAVGPGRPGACGPVYPGPISGEAPCAPEFFYDVIDITAAAAAAAAGGVAQPTLALQCYNNPNGGPFAPPRPGGDASRVALQVHAYFGDDAAPVVVGTSASAAGGWLAFDASALIAPSCCTESAWFFGPQENWDLRAEPEGWKTAAFAPGTGWAPPAAAGPFPGALVAKPTLSLRVIEGLAPAASWLHPSGAGVVYDAGREIQGGFALTLPGAAPAGVTWVVQAGEELQADGSVLYRMRTGNNYTHTVTSRAGGGGAALHEYMEFRYLQVLQQGAGAGAGCAASKAGDYTTPLTLSCGGAGVIQWFSFASWGAPSGACEGGGGSGNTFAVNASCGVPSTNATLTALCGGRRECTFTPSDAVFSGGKDPCHLVNKRLAAAWVCSGPPPAPPLPPPNATLWQVFYPASFAEDAARACPGGAAGTGVAGGSAPASPQFYSSAPQLDAIFAFCLYTVRATNLDLVTDSNTRQRSPVCAEAALATNRGIGQAAYEAASQALLTGYILNMSPDGAGWAEWQALLLQGVRDLHEASGDLDLFAAHPVLLPAYLERELFAPTANGSASLLWRCPGKGPWSCEQPEVDWPQGQRDGFVMTPTNSVVNSHYVGALRAFADLADAAGDSVRAAAARANATALAAAIVDHLWDPTRRAFVDGLETSHAAVHSTVYALANGVTDGAPAGVAEAAWATLVARLDPVAGIPVGPYPGLFYGEALFRNTSDHGRAAVGSFLLNNGTNSWLSQLRQGATTTMESWTPGEKPNLTWSHPWMAFPLSLITRWLLGVRPLAAGYARVLVQPQPGPLARAGGVVPTLRGPVAVAVAQVLGLNVLPTAFAMNLTLPGGVGGTACMPLPACAGARVVVDGVGVAAAVSGDFACVDLSEGAHQLSCP